MFAILPQLGVGFGAQAVADSPSAENYMESDMATALEEWGETLTVLRNVPSYSGGMAVHSWSNIGEILGDWQAVDGKTMLMEAELEIMSEAVVLCSIDVDVEENDKLQRSDGTFLYVNYVRKYEDHWTIYLKT